LTGNGPYEITIPDIQASQIGEVSNPGGRSLGGVAIREFQCCQALEIASP